MIDKFTRKEFEWFILFYLTAYISTKSIYAYDVASNYNPKFLYLCLVTLMIWLIASAKLKLFNVFLLVRQIIPTVILIWSFMIADYKHWKKYGVRIKHDK